MGSNPVEITKSEDGLCDKHKPFFFMFVGKGFE